MTEPLVSICIPAYNGTEFLEQCLQSCLAQTFQDYEIVICDDGSTDGTPDLIKKLTAGYSRVRFFQNPKNLGLVGNWNRCMEESRGAWIKFVFQDDYISNNCLETFVGAITGQTRLIVSKRNFVLPEKASDDMKNYYTQVVRTLVNTNSNRGNYFGPQLISRIAVQNMAMNFIGEPSLTFFRKECITELGLFNPHLKQICDFEFLLRVSSAHGLTYLPYKLCSFRIHSNTTTSTNVSDNYFVLHYIEPLLLSYFMIYGKQFNSFRSQLSVWHRYKLKLYFRLKAYQACKANIGENKLHYVFADNNTDFLPIKKVAKGSVFIRFLAMLRR